MNRFIAIATSHSGYIWTWKVVEADDAIDAANKIHDEPKDWYGKLFASHSDVRIAILHEQDLNELRDAINRSYEGGEHG